MIDFANLSFIILGLIVTVGLILLFLGGEWLSRGAACLALKFNIDPLVIGLTIVALATSMPELITSFYAAKLGQSGLAVGNVIGSNIANIGLILGIASIICPLEIHIRLIRKEVPLLMGVTIIYYLMCIGGIINRWEGLILVIGLIGYIYYIIKSAKYEDPKVKKEFADEVKTVEKEKKSILYCCFFIIGGALLLHFGASLLVGSAKEIAYRLGVSDTLIGLTIVAVGTSLPELGASVVAALRNQADISAGNIVGSNLFNLLLIGGGVPLCYPLKVDHKLLFVDFPVMLILTGLIWRFFVTDRLLTRLEGVGLLLLYIICMSISSMNQLGILSKLF